MKKIVLTILGIVLALSITACGNTKEKVEENDNDDWQEMSTESKEEVKEKEKSSCELNGHSWSEATCKTPKTCTECGITEGESKEHDVDTETGRCKICDEKIWIILTKYNYEEYLGYSVKYDSALNCMSLKLEAKDPSVRFVDKSQVILNVRLFYKKQGDDKTVWNDVFRVSLEEGIRIIDGDTPNIKNYFTFTGDYEIIGIDTYKKCPAVYCD